MLVVAAIHWEPWPGSSALLAAPALFAAAASQGLVSVVSVLASLYPVATVALARVYLRERVTRVQEAGAVATLGGVVLVSAG